MKDTIINLNKYINWFKNRDDKERVRKLLEKRISKAKAQITTNEYEAPRHYGNNENHIKLKTGGEISHKEFLQLSWNFITPCNFPFTCGICNQQFPAGTDLFYLKRKKNDLSSYYDYPCIQKYILDVESNGVVTSGTSLKKHYDAAKPLTKYNGTENSLDNNKEPGKESVKLFDELDEENFFETSPNDDLENPDSGKSTVHGMEYRTYNVTDNFNKFKRLEKLKKNDFESLDVRKVKINDKENLSKKLGSIEVLLYDVNNNVKRFFGTGKLFISKSSKVRANKKNTKTAYKNWDVGIRNFAPFDLDGSYIKPVVPIINTPKFGRCFLSNPCTISKSTYDDLIEIIKNPTKHAVKNSDAKSLVDSDEIISDAGEILVDDEVNVKDPSVPLELPSMNEIEKGIKEIQKELLIDENKIKEILMQLKTRHVILTGAIGTGKTEIAKAIPKKIWSSSKFPEGYEIEVYTATNEWTTADVISGTFPKLERKNLEFEEKNGCVIETIEKHKKPSEGSCGTWLLIDEFNRADIDKAFGQLFTGLADNKIQKSMQGNGLPVTIPRDYRILGTMNTNDKTHLYQLSDALKRRFAFVDIPAPDIEKQIEEMSIALEHALKINNMEKSQFVNNIVFGPDGLIDVDSSHRIDLFTTAYAVLAITRSEKSLGTAILTGIYQNLVSGLSMNLEAMQVLDSALNTGLAPQMEQMSSEFFDLFLKIVETGNDVNIYTIMSGLAREHENEKYQNIFSELMISIGINNSELKDKKNIVSSDNKAIIDEKWTIFSKNVLWERLDDLNEFVTSVTSIRQTLSL